MQRSAIAALWSVVSVASSFAYPVAVKPDPLAFPAKSFALKAVTVKTSKGQRKVAYRLYQHIAYVARPVDKAYQSLDVEVPVAVDGLSVDASRAPILLNIGVGGYMSSSNLGGGFGPGSPGGLPGGPMGPPPGGFGGPPPGGPMGMPGFGGPGGNGKTSGKTDLALAAGYVVVSPGCRGRDNRAANGTYYGKAPAAIVDLKAAVRYIRHNRGVLPGNPNWIVSTGVSAGGALSALLGASGNSPLYTPYLKEIGAASERDDVFASADFCPITDLEHADGAYEWMFGQVPTNGNLVDQTLSKQLAQLFTAYEPTLHLHGRRHFGTLTAKNLDSYLETNFLIPSATSYLSALPASERTTYLKANPWITWSQGRVAFTFASYLPHVGRKKNVPAFDDFALRNGEPILFGNQTTDARHFTSFTLAHETGSAKVDPEVQHLVTMMNPMPFILGRNPGVAPHWWIRHGTKDSDTSLPIIINLGTALENAGKDVNLKLYWDAGHGADLDPEDFVKWVGKLTGFE